MEPPKDLNNLPIGEKNPYGKYFNGQSYLNILTKEQDGSRSAYIAHIGGFFTFVALAGLSLIGWGLNHHCWLKKSCCFKEYHNPLNIRVFWWMSFMGLLLK